ncbi:oxidoreductase [Mycobacterium sp. 852013-50091_SCH5140682]|uniref:Gfo/Idh/MocA family protein n=1 Tax=Mycobacterium sp. 852013-50091_SCH5140682 TaxID=1834109 RepID=UPI0007E94629|nr:Gfo/Idh/MocA family oxidoreductase [Mycobacterium sp. 852013-50091_SCH5140682]OBC15944.1 oxidoreductase [Mycobacterium sp. 852013-50091_SCH5140682]
MSDLRLSAGMVGGGEGADIGKTHRQAMRLDDQFVLSAGVFGRGAAASARMADRLGVDRIYPDYREMAAAEATRPDGVDVVVVATPNDSHFDIASAFLRAGISVVCEKPLTRDAASAAELVSIAASTGAILAVPHCYSAYAMVRHAAHSVRAGQVGRVRSVVVEHASGWASTPLERAGHKQAAWRTDPDIAGKASVVGDLGTHAYHLLRYITGLEADEVSAELSTLVPGRRTYDNAAVRLRLSNGAPATLWASMAATGNEHGLRIRVFGETGALEWRHEDPHHLIVRDLAGGTTVLTQGMASLSDDAQRLTRPGLGHPEGFLEAFANFYLDLAEMLRGRRDGTALTPRELTIPTGVDGLIGVQFVEAVESSHDRNGAWVAPAVAALTGV